MNENFIIVKSVNAQDLEQIVFDLANLYSETESVNGIEIWQQKDQNKTFLLLFSFQPDFESFCYFINHIDYPQNFEQLNPLIKGYFKVDDIHDKYDFKIGKWINVYISDTNKSYDNVNIVNELNDNYLYDFDGDISKLKPEEVEVYSLDDINKENFIEISTIYPDVPSEIKHKTSKTIGKKLNDFFVITTSLIFTIMGLFLCYVKEYNQGIATTLFFGFCFIFYTWKVFNPDQYNRIKNRNSKNG